MTPHLEMAYDHCRHVAREKARNFYYAFCTLPKHKRRAIYAAYAFCRLCDDIADGDAPSDQKREQLNWISQILQDSLQRNWSQRRVGILPEFIALADTASSFQIPHHYFKDVIQGVESDLIKTRFENFEELKSYCYRVASVVGLICIEIFGYEDKTAREHATNMGIAMQLTNILRDIREDAEIDRIYIPLDEMAQFGYSEKDLKASVFNKPFRELMAFQVARARDYYQRSEKLFPLLESESRACPKVLHAAYLAILNRIEAANYAVFSHRIGLSFMGKSLIVGRLWTASFLTRLSILRH